MSKKIFKKSLAILTLLTITACSSVEPGYVGVKVNKLGSAKGIDTQTLGVGRYWIGFNEELYTFPTFNQQQIWTKNSTEGSPDDDSISFQSSEGLIVNTDVGISFEVIPAKIPEIFAKYRKDIDYIKDIVLRNAVRDAFNTTASNMGIENIYGKGKTILLNNVKNIVREQFKGYLSIDSIYLVGELRLPEQVSIAINSKIAATQDAQRIENKTRQTEAEMQQKVIIAKAEAESVLIKAKSQAESNKLLSESLTPEYLSYLKAIKWNGTLPSTVLGNGTVPIINLQ